jgi:Phage terminase large subunit (GpA)
MNNLTPSSNTRNALWQEKLRRHPDDPYAWTMVHRRISGQPLQHLDAIAEIMRDRHPSIVVRKSAQVGLSEACVNLALWAADTGYAGRGNVLFLMPTQNVMDDFAQARFDRALQESPYLRGRLQPEPPRRKGADSKRLKHLGAGYIYLRGTDSRRQLASVDADLVILDEFDQMADGIRELAHKRLASSRNGRMVIASTPRMPEAGIDALYRHSDQRQYFLPCPGCGLEQALEWETNVDLDRTIVVCRECRAPMNVLAKGQWIAQAPGNSAIHGYQLSRLYSPWVNISEMIADSQSTTPSGMQEFRNSDLGLPFVPPGGGLSVDDLDSCRDGYELGEYQGQPCWAGVDVGLCLHAVIREATDGQRPARLWFAGELAKWEELSPLMARYNVQGCMVDAHPEGHKAMEFQNSTGISVWRAYYDRHEQVLELEQDRMLFHMNRTLALDNTFERFRDHYLTLPTSARDLGGRVKMGLGDYYRQVLAPQRTMERDAQGNWVARWVEHSRPDHYAHAELYCLMAEAAAAQMRFSKTVNFEDLERMGYFDGYREASRISPF